MPIHSTDTPVVLVRALTRGDEAQARQANAELEAEGCEFLPAIGPSEAWDEYLSRREHFRTSHELPEGIVPETTMVGVLDDTVVGALRVRHRLNARLERLGGHIGYSVRPRFRRRGYASALLRHGLGVANDLGIDSALVTCSDDNSGSILVIERCGGVLADVSDVPGFGLKRRYWLPTA